MPKFIQTILLLVCFAFTTNTQAQIINIPDANFLDALLLNSEGTAIAQDVNGNYINWDINGDNQIQQSEALLIYRLNLQVMEISSLAGIEKFTNLRYLECSDNKITSLNVSSLINLEELICAGNQLSLLNLGSLTNLKNINCQFNNLTSINVGSLTNLKYLDCQFNNLTTINVNALTNLVSLSCDFNQLSSLNVTGLPFLESLGFSNNKISTFNISSLPKLKSLGCSNNLLSSLNVSSFTKLENLYCSANQISNLNLVGLTKLTILECFENQLTSLNLSGLTNITYLLCYTNSLSTLDVKNMNNLKALGCSQNLLTNLDVSGLTKLEGLTCQINSLKTLDVTNCINIINLYCGFNELASLNLSSILNLKKFDCGPNRFLKYIAFKNNVNNSVNIQQYYNFGSCPSLEYICADPEELSVLRNRAILNGYSNIEIGSLCSSTLAGPHLNINGKVKLDADNNGCTSQDTNYQNLKMKISNATDSIYVITNSQGDFAIDLDSGSYIIIPQFSNSYFTVTPSSTNITLPEDTIPQQFCITPNGTHHDVSVTVIPIRAARPGFSDAKYKIVLKNKGNQLESGTILFKYDENKQDFISATSTPNSIISGELTFAFSNLIPFETREITVTMRTNSPTDNPAVNAGDVLNVQVGATLDNGVRDEYIKDNFLNIKQTVVGSIDPNDKTCLEGNIATPDVIGDFVNYLIRFENTGTANAENVVVTDFIDLAKFDISSLELTSTSHSCKTLNSNGNKVQFVFDNINLPYTDPNKYGYVAFKIKTKSNLVIGDSLKNTADIYFDYNLPIKTNTAATRIDNIILSTKNATNKEGSLSVYPNPSTGNFIINFESKGNFPITIKMMDLKGSVVLEKNINHSEKSTLTIDDKDISNGIYLINIHTEKENWMQKLMIVK